MGDWTVRRAQAGDGTGLAEVHLDTARRYLELDPTRHRMASQDGFVEWLNDDLEKMGKQWICFVAVDGDRIVGQVEAQLVPPLETARYQVVAALGSTRGYVNSLGVLRSHRRRGIGRSMMEHAERWLADRGVTIIELDTLESSPESVPSTRALDIGCAPWSSSGGSQASAGGSESSRQRCPAPDSVMELGSGVSTQ